MKKSKRILIVVMIFTFFLSGCKFSTNSSISNREIVIWSHLNDSETRKLREIAEQWAKSTGNKVKVHSDKGDIYAYLQAVKADKEPDIVFGVKQESLGSLYRENLVEEVPSNIINKENFAEVALNSVTYDKKIFGIPISMTTYALYYNKEKVKAPPKTLEELIDLGKKVGFQYDINNIYYSYTFLDAYGAEIFNNIENKSAVDNINLGNEGAINGLKLLRDMVQTYKFMPNDKQFNITKAKDNFKNGSIGLYIGEMWDIEDFEKAKLNFGVVPLPKINNKEAKSIVITQVALVSSLSKHKEESWSLMSYLTSKFTSIISKDDNKLPVVLEDLNNDKFKKDPVFGGFVQQALNSSLTINRQEMHGLLKASEYLHLITNENVNPELYGKLLTDVIKLEIIKQDFNKVE